jgi:soluble lytic murein transglycosylase-like protein
VSAAAWRPLIRRVVADVWPGLASVGGEWWIEAQLEQESQGVPNARSSEGAVGLLQLMPETAKELGLTVIPAGLDERLNPEKNVRAGVRYLLDQYLHLKEIPVHPDRLYWSFASYNGGRGFVNVALALARERIAAGTWAGDWWSWDRTSPLLADPRCQVPTPRGPVNPDAKQMRGYVAAIVRIYSALVAAGL